MGFLLGDIVAFTHGNIILRKVEENSHIFSIVLEL
jgi:hypothetical protein